MWARTTSYILIDFDELASAIVEGCSLVCRAAVLLSKEVYRLADMLPTSNCLGRQHVPHPRACNSLSVNSGKTRTCDFYRGEKHTSDAIHVTRIRTGQLVCLCCVPPCSIGMKCLSTWAGPTKLLLT